MSKHRWHVTSIGAAIVMAFLTIDRRQPDAGGRPARAQQSAGSPLEMYYAQPPGVRVETFLDGLDVVWGLQFAPDKRLFLTEKPGRIRVVSPNGTLGPDSMGGSSQRERGNPRARPLRCGPPSAVSRTALGVRHVHGAKGRSVCQPREPVS